jgi:hypothetical protein
MSPVREQEHERRAPFRLPEILSPVTPLSVSRSAALRQDGSRSTCSRRRRRWSMPDETLPRIT